MAGLKENRRSHSTLEWFGSDGTVGVPQALGPAITVGFDSTPEVDGATSAPEVRLGTSPEVFYSTLPPEAINNVEQSQNLVPAKAKSPKWGRWVLAILGLMLVAGLAIGLKVGLQKRNSPGPPPKPVNSSLTQQIIHDSSLAGTVATNGDRHLFFQAPQGAIRRLIYTANQWIPDPNPVTISDAKMLTPMAVNNPTRNQFGLYYITTKNRLNYSIFNGQFWYPGQDPTFNHTTAPDTRQLSLVTNSSESGRMNETVNQSLLVYEDSGGNVAALLQVYQLCGENNLISHECYNGENLSYWQDVTSINRSISGPHFIPVDYNTTYDPYWHQFLDNGVIISSTLYESRPDVKLSPPFAAGASTFKIGPGLNVDLLICDNSTQKTPFSPGSPSSPCNTVGYTTYRSWTNASHGFFEAQFDTEPDYNEDHGMYPYENAYSYLSIQESDLAIINYGSGSFALWINGTKPSLLGYNVYSDLNFGPNVSFPFKRLASIPSPEQNTSYLYHQIDGTTLAEEHYDYSVSRWLSTNITVPNA
ncbi:hypothetical protein BDR22DRAFT_890875 [Usnea florida]